MIGNVDLHLRPYPLEQHRALGVVEVEWSGACLAPYQDIEFRVAGRSVAAHVTSIRQNGDHLPHVYADTISAVELTE